MATMVARAMPLSSTVPRVILAPLTPTTNTTALMIRLAGLV